MTEAEAKTKWCPFVRLTAGAAAAGDAEWHTNRPSYADVEKSPFDCCVGSACMAWRSAGRDRGPIVERIKAEPGSAQPFGEHGGYEVIEHGNPAKGGNWVRYEPGPMHGYCGLAGAPTQ